MYVLFKDQWKKEFYMLYIDQDFGHAIIFNMFLSKHLPHGASFNTFCLTAVPIFAVIDYPTKK